jgi:hypothetical protein
MLPDFRKNTDFWKVSVPLSFWKEPRVDEDEYEALVE